MPKKDDLDGSWLNMTWLSMKFPTLPLNANDVAIQRYAKAYIL